MARKPKLSGKERRREFKEPLRTVLIGCEGERTEPDYFNCLINELELAVTAHVDVVGYGATPLTIIDRLINEKQNNDMGIEYDETWAVFDRDEHPYIPEALDKANRHNIKVALSIPCFEFWYLLHFRLTTKGFSKCKNVIDDLKVDIPDYGKGDCPFVKLYPKTNDAIKYAKNIRKHGGGDPLTDVDKLVQLLLNEAD